MNIKGSKSGLRRAATLVLSLLVYLGVGVGVVQASTFKQGTHYELVKNPKIIEGSSVEVLEFFNYGCPHCYHLEPAITKWKESKPDYIEFKQVPAFWNPTFKHYAQAFYTAQTLGKSDELHQAIFHAIHRVGQNLDIRDEAGLEILFERNGIEGNAFTKAYNSFATQQKLTMAGRLFREYGLRSVPVFVVDGRYVTDVGKAGSPDKLLEVIEFLAKEARASRMKSDSEADAY